MTREEIDKAVKKIRGHCRNRVSCRNCEAKSVYGCVFMSSYPFEWFTTEEADKAKSNESLFKRKECDNIGKN